jgi:hypothetical protein
VYFLIGIKPHNSMIFKERKFSDIQTKVFLIPFSVFTEVDGGIKRFHGCIHLGKFMFYIQGLLRAFDLLNILLVSKKGM